jgi:uncharacterized protein YbjT (DUF2867 family)
MPETLNPSSPRILITGVTGYVGGRLVDYLITQNYNLRVMSRDLSRLNQRSWSDRVERVEADVFQPETLKNALRNIDVAYYLIHSMSGNQDGGFAQRDVQAARNFAEAAKEQGVAGIHLELKKIAYD